MTLRPNIPNLRKNLARNLLLKVDVVVLHVGRADVAIERKGIAFEIATRRRIAVDRRSVNNRAAYSPGGENRLRTDGIIRGSGGKEGGIRQVPLEHVL